MAGVIWRQLKHDPPKTSPRRSARGYQPSRTLQNSPVILRGCQGPFSRERLLQPDDNLNHTLIVARPHIEQLIRHMEHFNWDTSDKAWNQQALRNRQWLQKRMATILDCQERMWGLREELRREQPSLVVICMPG
jgi:hypothetical protein